MTDYKFWLSKEIAQAYHEAVKKDVLRKFLLIPFLKKKMKNIDLRNKRVLDLGCGDGLCTYELFRKSKAKEIIGLDLSPWLISVAKQISNKDSRFKFFVQDLSKAFDYGKFDYIFSLNTLMDIKNLKAVAENIYKALKKNCIFDMVIVHPLYNMVVNEVKKIRAKNCTKVLLNLGAKYVKEEVARVRFITKELKKRNIKRFLKIYRRPEGFYVNVFSKYGLAQIESNYLTITKQIARKEQKLRDKIGFPIFYHARFVKI